MAKKDLPQSQPMPPQPERVAPKYSDTQTAAAPYTAAEKFAFVLRHAGAHSARAEGPRTVTLTPGDARETQIAAAAHMQRATYTLTKQPSAWVVEIAPVEPGYGIKRYDITQGEPRCMHQGCGQPRAALIHGTPFPAGHPFVPAGEEAL